jgi:integrase
VRDGLIPANPCEGIRLPRQQRTADHGVTIGRDAFLGLLLPAVPDRWRALVALAGGAGLRWGECVGLRWEAADLDRGLVYVTRVAVEVAGHVTDKPFPKSKASRRVVPLPPFVVELLRQHRARYLPGPAGQVFSNEAGGPPRRTLFRSRVWRPALVRAGLLGTVRQSGPSTCSRAGPRPMARQRPNSATASAPRWHSWLAPLTAGFGFTTSAIPTPPGSSLTASLLMTCSA